MKRIGFWEDDNVHPRTQVFHKWDIFERIRVIQYLRSGHCVRQSNRNESCYMSCSVTIGMENAEYNDGVWTWPKSLAHYIECHGVKPDDEFIEHIKNNSFRVPFLKK